MDIHPCGQTLRQLRINEGQTALFLNGIQISMNEPNLFEILSILNDDASIMGSLASFGVPNVLIPGFLSARFAANIGSLSCHSRALQ